MSYDSTVTADTPVLFISNGFTDSLGHTVTATGSPGTAYLPNGDIAAHFDGATQYLTVTSAADISLPATGGVITIEAWMKPDVLDFPHHEGTATPDGYYVHWMGKGNPTDGYEWVSRMYDSNTTTGGNRHNRISGYCFNTAGGIGVGSFWEGGLLSTDDGTPPGVIAGEWIHYVLKIDRTDPTVANQLTKVYRNGILMDHDAFSTTVTTPGATVAPVRIGTRDLASFFQGAIGKVAIYNYDLSAARILAHYNAIWPAPVTLSIDDLEQQFFMKVAARRNLVKNPAAVGTSHWGSSAGTGGAAALTNVGSGGPNGNTFNRVTWSTASTSPVGGIFVGSSGNRVAGIVAGKPYSGSIWVRCSKAQTFALRIGWLDNAEASLGTVTNPTTVAVAANTWTRLTYENQVAPANAAMCSFQAYGAAAGVNWAIGDTVDGCYVNFERSATANSYYDGTTGPLPSPATVLNIGSAADKNHFGLQIARSGDGAYTEITQAQVESGFEENLHFTTVPGPAVRLRVPYDAPVIGGSAGPRCELRENNADGTLKAFDALVGDHEMHGRTKITSWLAATPDIVVAQLHNGTADRIALRTQLVSGTLRLRLRINGTSVTVSNGTLDIENPYVQGTEFEWKILVTPGGAVRFFYKDMTNPIYTGPVGTLVSTGSASWYFKAGCYAQATGLATDIASVELRDFYCHSGQSYQSTVPTTYSWEGTAHASTTIVNGTGTELDFYALGSGLTPREKYSLADHQRAYELAQSSDPNENTLSTSALFVARMRSLSGLTPVEKYSVMDHEYQYYRTQLGL